MADEIHQARRPFNRRGEKRGPKPKVQSTTQTAAKPGAPKRTPANDPEALFKAVILADVITPGRWRPDWRYGDKTWPAAVEGAIRRVTAAQEGKNIPSGGGNEMVHNARGGPVTAGSRIKHLREYFAEAGACKEAVDAWIVDPSLALARIPAIADAIRATSLAKQEARRRDPVAVIGDLVAHALLMRVHSALDVGRLALSAASLIEVEHNLPTGFVKHSLFAMGLKVASNPAAVVAEVAQLSRDSQTKTTT